MIIGEKIRSLNKTAPVVFNDLYFARLMDMDKNKLSLFGEESVISIIDSQWKTT